MQSLYNETTQQYIVAIGEIGIDTYWPNTHHTLDIQKELFRRQCEYARLLKLPIVIHSRANREATHEILKNFTDLRIYFHCWSYSPLEIHTIQTTYKDFYIGFCGNISYPKAEILRKSAWYLIYGNENYPDHVLCGKPTQTDHTNTVSDQ